MARKKDDDAVEAPVEVLAEVVVTEPQPIEWSYGDVGPVFPAAELIVLPES